MTQTIFSDFGIKLGISVTLPATVWVDVAQLIKLAPPSIQGSEVETSNHSASAKSFISGGVYEVTEFKMTIEYDKGNTLIAQAVSGVPLGFKVTFPNTETWSFTGFIKGFAPSDADSTKPNVLSAEVTIRPTGASTVA